MRLTPEQWRSTRGSLHDLMDTCDALLRERDEFLAALRVLREDSYDVLIGKYTANYLKNIIASVDVVLANYPVSQVGVQK